MGTQVLISNDAVVLGLLMITLAFVFKTSSSDHTFWKKFYTYVPSLLLCYFIPALFNSFGLIDGSSSGLYNMSKNYLLPTSLFLLTISIDLKGIAKLGKKALIMFLAGTVGIVLGGPLAILIVSFFSPETVGGAGPDAIWRGMATIAGSWIGGGANQAAMYEVFGASPDLFAKMIAVDVLVANVWMAFLLFGAGRSAKVDKFFHADASAIEEVQVKIENYRKSILRIPSLADLMMILGAGFAATALSHFTGDWLAPLISNKAPYLEQYSLTSSFFWVVILSTTFGLIISFTRFKKYEGAGASRVGSAMLYVLVATVGMQMDIKAILESPDLFLLGIIWMLVHISILLGVAKIIKAPFFFVAVGSQANVGGAASAPIVASAFNPSLAPVGVLLAVLGYALGTYGAWLCGILMQAVAP